MPGIRQSMKMTSRAGRVVLSDCGDGFLAATASRERDAGERVHQNVSRCGVSSTAGPRP
jgi:hypothetical protein